jgi:hypothetical protein
MYAPVAPASVPSDGWRMTMRILPPTRRSTSAIGVSQPGMPWSQGLDTNRLDFFANFFGCAAALTSGHRWFCDPPARPRGPTRGRPLPDQRNPARLLATRIDREIVDRALAVPLVNPHFGDFVSARVRDYRAHPILGLIVDQVSLR